MESSYKKELRKARQLEGLVTHPLLNIQWNYKKVPSYHYQTVNSSPVSTEENQIEKLKVSTDIQHQKEQIIPDHHKQTSVDRDASDTLKDDVLFTNLVKFNLLQFEEIKNIYGSINDELFFDKFPLHNRPLDIVFVNDKNEGIEDSIFSYYFKSEVAELFSKMTKAMKLKKQSFSISSLKLNIVIHKTTQNNQLKTNILDNLSENTMLVDTDRFCSEIFHLRPKIIMTLGAQAYQAFIGHEMRLKDVHGQLQDITLQANSGVFSTKIMPIFSPNLLHTAPNMKKTAWADLQKAMEYLN